MSYNTAVAGFMEFTNTLYRWVQSEAGPHRQTLDTAVETLLLVMAPAVPHMCAELWERRRNRHIHTEDWPVADPHRLVAETVTLVVQVNGRVRDRIEVAADADAADVEAAGLGSAKVHAFLRGEMPARVITRPPKLVNFVV